MKNIFYFLLVFLPFLFTTACTSAGNSTNNTNSGDDNLNYITVSNENLTITAKEDGLHISKKNDKNLRSVGIHVKSGNIENVYLNADISKNDYVYPFVSARKDYEVWLSFTDQNWATTTSSSLNIESIGGLGDYNITYDSYEYNNKNISIDVKNYKINRPQVLITAESYSGNTWYNINSSNIWSSPQKYANYTEKDGKFDISSVSDVIVNTNFFIQINYNMSYGSNSYSSLVLDTWQTPFSDRHPISNISANKGIMRPEFNPAITDYMIVGTAESVILTPTLFSGATTENATYLLNNIENSTVAVSAKVDDFELTYNFTFGKVEEVTFQGITYLKTFEDNFEGDTLNLKNWRQSPEQERQGPMPNHGWWSNECSYVKDGHLVLENKVVNGKNLSGSIDTEQTFWQSHGFYEIKFKCEKASGLWYAFWLMGKNDEAHIGHGATNAAEIDVFELIPNENNSDKNGKGYANTFKTTIHWDAYGSSHKSKGSDAADIDDSFYDDWHVAQFVWGETSYDLYLDGKLLWKLDASKEDQEHFGGMCNGKNYIIISSEFGNWGGDIHSDLLPAHMYVDYVKAYIQK